MFPNIKLDSAGGFLQLAFVFFGFILAGFAAATLVAGWASDEGSGRLDSLLSTPLARGRWAVSGGLGIYAVLAVLTAIMAICIGAGAAIGGGDIVTPVVGTVVLGLYAMGLAGIGLAVGGVLRTSFAGEIVAGVVILTFVIDLRRAGPQAAGLDPPARAHRTHGSTHGRRLGSGRDRDLQRPGRRGSRPQRLGDAPTRHRGLSGRALTAVAHAPIYRYTL